MMVKGTLAFTGGIVLLQQLADLPPAWLLWCAPLGIAACILFKFTTLRLVCYAVLGSLWAQYHAQSLLDQRLPAHLIKHDIQVVGTIAALPEPFEHGQRFEFAIRECVQPTVARCPQRVRLSWYRPEGIALRPGQTWAFTVRLKPPRSFGNPGSFDYSGWLLQKRIVATGYINTRQRSELLGHDWRDYPVQQARHTLQRFFVHELGEQRSEPLLRALLIGDRSGMTSTHWQVLQKTGTVHLMAISGLHVGLIAGLSFFVMHWLWRRSSVLCLYLAAPRAAAIVAWCMALLYAALAGFAIPTQRALIMLAVVLFAVVIQRPVKPVYVLCMALLFVLLLDPFAVLAAGFWLSFAAVALIYYLLARQALQPVRLWRWINMQIAISLGLLPLVVLYFQQAPILSPLTNLLAIPWVSFVVLPLAMLSLVLCSLPGEPGVAGLELVITLLDVLFGGLEWTAAWPLSIVSLPAPTLTSLMLALSGMLLLLLPRPFPARYLGLLLCLPLLFPAGSRPAQGEAVVTLLDVGQGLATVVMTREHTLVFDTGPAFSERFNTGAAVVLPYLRAQNVHALDMLIVSHGDLDHIGGAAAVLNTMPVQSVLSSVPGKLGGAAQLCARGMRWTWDGIEFDMLNPVSERVVNTKDNDRSCVLQIRAGGHSILLTGDIETGTEAVLAQTYGHALHSSVLVVPHHGSKTSSSELFLEHVRPQIALFPVGWLNRYNHPHPDVSARYAQRGIRRYDTAQHGAIRVRLGDTLAIDTFRTANRRYWHVP